MSGERCFRVHRDLLDSAEDHQPAAHHRHELMSAVPVPDPTRADRREAILLAGDLPSPAAPPSGCVFHTRCPKYRDRLDADQRRRCDDEVPALTERAAGHFAACHVPEVRGDRASAQEAPAG